MPNICRDYAQQLEFQVSATEPRHGLARLLTRVHPCARRQGNHSSALRYYERAPVKVTSPEADEHNRSARLSLPSRSPWEAACVHRFAPVSGGALHAGLCSRSFTPVLERRDCV